jgi:queuine/archaeosine tRNA-ribosyltransferase
MTNLRLIEARLDGKKVKVFSDPRGVSTDHTAVFIANSQLKKVLTAHQVILGVDEYLGSQVVMQFDMPDSSPVVTTCSKERSLQAK